MPAAATPPSEPPHRLTDRARRPQAFSSLLSPTMTTLWQALLSRWQLKQRPSTLRTGERATRSARSQTELNLPARPGLVIDGWEPCVKVDPRFVELYESEHDRVFQITLVLCRDRGLAEDATQEAFARALERWPRLSERSWVAGWVTSTALNVARRALRRRPLPGGAPPERPGPRIQHRTLGGRPRSSQTPAGGRRLALRSRSSRCRSCRGDGLPGGHCEGALGPSPGSSPKATGGNTR